jgi:hypothetical protein
MKKALLCLVAVGFGCGLYVLGIGRTPVSSGPPFESGWRGLEIEARKYDIADIVNTFGRGYDKARIGSALQRTMRATAPICKNASRNRAVSVLKLRGALERYCP